MGGIFAGLSGAALLKILAPIIEAIFNGIGRSFNDWLAQQRAEQANRDLGAAKTAAQTNAATVETQDAMDAITRPSDDAVANSLRRGEF